MRSNWSCAEEGDLSEEYPLVVQRGEVCLDISESLEPVLLHTKNPQPLEIMLQVLKKKKELTTFREMLCVFFFGLFFVCVYNALGFFKINKTQYLPQDRFLIGKTNPRVGIDCVW